MYNLYIIYVPYALRTYTHSVHTWRLLFLSRLKCDPARVYVHKIHLFILQYISSLLCNILEPSKLYEVPYEKLYK